MMLTDDRIDDLTRLNNSLQKTVISVNPLPLMMGENHIIVTMRMGIENKNNYSPRKETQGTIKVVLTEEKSMDNTILLSIDDLMLKVQKYIIMHDYILSNYTILGFPLPIISNIDKKFTQEILPMTINMTSENKPESEIITSSILMNTIDVAYSYYEQLTNDTKVNNKELFSHLVLSLYLSSNKYGLALEYAKNPHIFTEKSGESLLKTSIKYLEKCAKGEKDNYPESLISYVTMLTIVIKKEYEPLITTIVSDVNSNMHIKYFNNHQTINGYLSKIKKLIDNYYFLIGKDHNDYTDNEVRFILKQIFSYSNDFFLKVLNNPYFYYYLNYCYKTHSDYYNKRMRHKYSFRQPHKTKREIGKYATISPNIVEFLYNKNNYDLVKLIKSCTIHQIIRHITTQLKDDYYENVFHESLSKKQIILNGEKTIIIYRILRLYYMLVQGNNHFNHGIDSKIFHEIYDYFIEKFINMDTNELFTLEELLFDTFDTIIPHLENKAKMQIIIKIIPLLHDYLLDSKKEEKEKHRILLLIINNDSYMSSIINNEITMDHLVNIVLT